MRRLLLVILILAASALSSALVSDAATAQSGAPFYWESIDVLIDVQENGDMLVTETQTYVFTGRHNNQRYRYIPLDRVDGIDDITVSLDGRNLSVDTAVEGDQRWIRWTHPLNPPETLTFVLRYRVRGGLHLDKSGDQVYWKALFKEREAEIRSGSVTVRLPESLAGQITDYRNFGWAAAARQVDPRTVQFVLSGALPPGRELEVQVTFPHGLLNVPTPNRQRGAGLVAERWNAVRWISRGLGIVLILLTVFLLRRLLRPKREGSPRPNTVVTRPPSDLPAPAVSMLESREASPRTMLAMLVEMGQQGRLQIESEDVPGERRRYRYRRSGQDTAQFEWETALLRAIPSGQAVTADALVWNLMGRRRQISNQLGEYLRHRGLFEVKPAGAMTAGDGGAWWVFSLFPVLGIALFCLVFAPVFLVGVASLSLFLLWIYFRGKRDDDPAAPTVIEPDEIDQWIAFKETLRTGPQGTYRDGPDSLLPYAIALGVRRTPEWSNDADVPDWFSHAEVAEGNTRKSSYAFRDFARYYIWDMDSEQYSQFLTEAMGGFGNDRGFFGAGGDGGGGGAGGGGGGGGAGGGGGGG